MTSLEKALFRIARILKARKIPYMVIGGVANLFWGIPRTTLDIDVTIKVQEESYLSLIERVKHDFKLRVDDPLSFIRRTSVLPIEDRNGIRLDLIFARLPYEFKAIRRSKRVRVHGEWIQVCSPEDLIIHKIISERPRDREDVQGIISLLRGKLDRRYLDPIVKELAKELAKPELLKFYRSCFSA